MSKTVDEPKKFVIEYQPEDDQGNPIGPLQHFEADTQKELLDKVAAAHKSASTKLYETRKRVKLGEILTPDPEEPIQSFQEKALTADELVGITNALKDPKTAPDAYKALLESQFGAPVEEIRKALRQVEIDKRTRKAQEEVDLFLEAHPEYIQCESNKITFLKYLEKRSMALTKRNLEIAYEDLVSDGLLLLQVKKEEPVQTVQKVNKVEPEKQTVSSSPEKVEEVVAPSNPAIPEKTASTPPISEPVEVPRPRTSSSGLSRDSGGALPSPSKPKTQGITAADIRRMTADQYARFTSDPANRKIVEELYKK